MTMLMACSSEEEIKEGETKVPLDISIGKCTFNRRRNDDSLSDVFRNIRHSLLIFF